MAHRHVMDKDGNAKYVHSSHGDVPHADAQPGHGSAKVGHSERNLPHGHNAHPDPRHEHKAHQVGSDEDADEEMEEEGC